MKEINLQELKIIQMDILSAVHRFCVAKGIRYSIACGTMLGAARHKGYIPWDDDIDIYLLREDYNQLIREFPNKLDGKYEFATLERSKKWDKPYGKIYDIRTVLKESNHETFEMGVNIDVFPIDAVPEDIMEWKKYDRKRRNMQILFSLRYIGYDKMTFDNKRIMHSLYRYATKALVSCIPTRLFAKYLHRLATKFNGSDSAYVFECAMGIFCKNPFKKDLFNHLVLMPFENRQYYGFVDYDEFLSSAFGDWRKLPPEEKRVSHHNFIAWWK